MMAISKVIQKTIDPFLIAGVNKQTLSKSKQSEIAREVADFIAEQILLKVGSSTSPVGSFGKFDGLSPEYRKFKKSQGAGGSANLELSGDMLDRLVSKKTSDNKVVTGPDTADEKKADNHNHGRIFGAPTVPPRRFIPKRNQKYSEDIMRGIRDIVNNLIAGE